jgi:hypothetical protein
MKPKLLLRIAAVFMLLHDVGHAMGALTWKAAPNAAVAATIAAMTNNKFLFMGRMASLAAFLDGYGITMIFVLLLLGILLWIFAGHTENSLTKILLTPIMLFLWILAVVEYVYFFPFAASFTALAALCTLIARIKLK